METFIVRTDKESKRQIKPKTIKENKGRGHQEQTKMRTVFLLLLFLGYSLGTPIDNASGDHLIRNSNGAVVGRLLGPPQTLTIGPLQEHLFQSGVLRDFPLPNVQLYTILDIGFRSGSPNYFVPLDVADNCTFDSGTMTTHVNFSVTTDGDFASIVRLSDFSTPAACTENACFECVSEATDYCLDCEGTPFGSVFNDICGECGGNASCLDCRGLLVPEGDKWVVDQCGVCGGDGTSCQP